EVKGEVDRARFTEGRAVDGAEEGRGDRVWPEIEKSERSADRISNLACRRQRRPLVRQEAVGARVDLDRVERSSGTNGAAAVQEGPAIADPAPAQVTVDGVPGRAAAKHLDRGAQVVFGPLPGE